MRENRKGRKPMSLKVRKELRSSEGVFNAEEYLRRENVETRDEVS